MLSILALALALVAACSPQATGHPTAADAQANLTNAGDKQQIGANTQAFLTSLGAAHAGDTIALAPGDYGFVTIKNLSFSPAVTITSKDPVHPATFDGMSVQASAGLTFRDLEFDASKTPVDQWGPEHTVSFTVTKSDRVAFEKVTVHGDPKWTLAQATSGMMIRNSTHVGVSDSDFSYLHNAFQHWQDNGLVLSGNHFHHIWDDAMRGGSDNVTVSGNDCYSNHQDKADTDHPDCIQMWTRGQNMPFSNILIENNTYERGVGTPTQFIFVKDITAYPPFVNVTIRGNTAHGAIWNGIMVQNARNVIIESNRVVPGCDQLSWIRVENVDGATLTNNTAGTYILKNNVGLTEKDDTKTGCK